MTIKIRFLEVPNFAASSGVFRFVQQGVPVTWEGKSVRAVFGRKRGPQNKLAEMTSAAGDITFEADGYLAFHFTPAVIGQLAARLYVGDLLVTPTGGDEEHLALLWLSTFDEIGAVNS